MAEHEDDDDIEEIYYRAFVCTTLSECCPMSHAEWHAVKETGMVPISWALRAATALFRALEERDEYNRRWGEAVDVGVSMAQASSANILKLILSGCLTKPKLDGS